MSSFSFKIRCAIANFIIGDISFIKNVVINGEIAARRNVFCQNSCFVNDSKVTVNNIKVVP